MLNNAYSKKGTNKSKGTSMKRKEKQKKRQNIKEVVKQSVEVVTLSLAHPLLMYVALDRYFHVDLCLTRGSRPYYLLGLRRFTLLK